MLVRPIFFITHLIEFSLIKIRIVLAHEWIVKVAKVVIMNTRSICPLLTRVLSATRER